MPIDDLILTALALTLCIGVLWLLFYAADEPQPPEPPASYSDLSPRERYAFAARFIAGYHENATGEAPRAIILLREGEGDAEQIRTFTSKAPLDAADCAALINRTGALHNLTSNICPN